MAPGAPSRSSAADPWAAEPVDSGQGIRNHWEGSLTEPEQQPGAAGEVPDLPPAPSPNAERGKTVHGELANAGHRVLGSDDAEVEAYLEVALDAPAPSRTPSDPPPTAATVPEPGVVAVLDFGSQYSQLITRRVREQNVYCELLPADASWEPGREANPKGRHPVGRPSQCVRGGRASGACLRVESGRFPRRGSATGCTSWPRQLGGTVEARRPNASTVGRLLTVKPPVSPIFSVVPADFEVWMSHGDKVGRSCRRLCHPRRQPDTLPADKRGDGRQTGA